MLNPGAPLAQGAVFLGLGRSPGGLRCRDESEYGSHGVLTNMDPLTDWVFEPNLGRWALDLDGLNDCINATGVTTNADTTWWFSIWMYSRSSTGLRYLLDSQTGRCILGVPDDADKIAYYSDAWDIFGTYPTLNTWHAMFLQVSGTKAQLFVDGIQLGETATVAARAIGGSVSLGAKWTREESYFSGCLSDMLIGKGIGVHYVAALADPSNVMLQCGGVDGIATPRRRWWAVGAGAPPAGHPAARRFGGVPFCRNQSQGVQVF
jgi:hypothetical protein